MQKEKNKKLKLKTDETKIETWINILMQLTARKNLILVKFHGKEEV